MTDLLQQEITRPPVTVTIAGKAYPIAFTMAAAIAYKQATGTALLSYPLRTASTCALAASIASRASVCLSTDAISLSVSPRAPESAIAIAVPIE